jgi:cob(I)alamin adenosyltransferase
MKLSTKTGDGGKTGLIGGQRVSKDDARVASYGEVDELNATLGLVVAALADDAWCADLHAIQSDLFTLGAQLAVSDGAEPHLRIAQARIDRLDKLLHEISATLPELTNFVLPGGTELAARLHLARTVCRRAERGIVALAQRTTIDPMVIVYLNRLSDLLFAYALAANHRAGVDDIVWRAP